MLDDTITEGLHNHHLHFNKFYLVQLLKNKETKAITHNVSKTCLYADIKVNVQYGAEKSCSLQ
jgi:hypothetical protein